MLRKFGVIKLWPKLKTAEDECIARIKSAAAAAGLECIEVDYAARLTAPPHTQLTANDVDFILSLHFETPKCYDIFSFVALWNPLQFYYDWGYRKFTGHLLTHDDFLSCSSPWADDHVLRNIAGDPTRDRPRLRLYHSLAAPLFEPALGDGKLFYVGINWERVSGKSGRHEQLLTLLDQAGSIRIFGPKEFQGIEVWRGYRGYSGPIPFDGISVVREIHRAGIGLALSSKAHTQSELMSNRLFECLAAGVVTICDENPFGRKFFGDSLLYIDTTLPPGKIFEQLTRHIDWIRANPERALELAARAQQIFREKFTLTQCLENLYAGLASRKQELRSLCLPQREHGPIDVLFMMPVYDAAVLDAHLESFCAQDDVALRPVLLMNTGDFAEFGERVRARLADAGVAMEIEAVEFFDSYPDGSVRARNRVGAVLSDALRRVLRNEYFCIVGPNELLFSNHFALLLKALDGDPDAAVAAGAMLEKLKTEPYIHLRPDVRAGDFSPGSPLGYGRFLFRRSAVPDSIHAALPYLDAAAIHLLVFPNRMAKSSRATLVLDGESSFNRQFKATKISEEREILIDYAPESFRDALKANPAADFETLDEESRTKIAVALAHSVPFPNVVKRIGFGTYRWWLKRSNS